MAKKVEPNVREYLSASLTLEIVEQCWADGAMKEAFIDPGVWKVLQTEGPKAVPVWWIRLVETEDIDERHFEYSDTKPEEGSRRWVRI